MRILRFVALVSRSGVYGGPSDSALRQAVINVRRGDECAFLAGFFGGDRPTISAPGLKLRLYRARMLSRRASFPSVVSLKGLVTVWVEVLRADVVHVSIARELMPLYAAIVTIACRRRLVLQPHGMISPSLRLDHRFVDVFLRPVFAMSSGVICLTDVEAGRIRSWAGRYLSCPIWIVGNPVIRGASEFDGCKGESSVAREDEVLFLGRLHRRKRVDVFVAAAQLAKVRDWPGRWVAVGPDEGELGLISQSSAVSYEQGIPADDVAERVSQCAVFVLPSYAEPWGNVLVMALTLGKPVVVMASAALAGVIRSYGAGLVVEDGDVEELAAAVRRVLDDRALRETLIAGARRFTAERLLDRTVSERMAMAYAAALANGHEWFRKPSRYDSDHV